MSREMGEKLGAAEGGKRIWSKYIVLNSPRYIYIYILEKEEAKLSPLTNDMILYLKVPNDNTIELNKQFQ